MKKKKKTKLPKPQDLLAELTKEAKDIGMRQKVFDLYKSTKFILLAETLDEDKGASVQIVTDGKSYRSQNDYLGMMEAIRTSILSNLVGEHT